ncbi:hypothetical protein Clacol_002132 [Clathrus columnatus]|uniref:Uncharacterized protein n=1 Tax=Clathrus columnatus TaxID=1419009 RepID=A0AAV5A4I6_9AGAM|nr:hypothetical protein Clacol_002132 [Clathrus columnatus]
MLKCHGIQYAALRQALIWKPSINLFSPKLTILQWDAPSKYIEYLPSLVPLTLQTLQVRLDTIKNLNMMDVFCKTIPFRSPSLRALEFIFPPANKDTQTISRSLAELFSLLSEIIFLRLPPHCMAEELFTTLSRLPQLQTFSLLQHSYFVSMEGDLIETLPKRKFDADEEAGQDIPFCSLGRIHIDISSIPDSDFMMTEVLRRGIQLLNLVHLTYSGFPLNHTITFMESLHRICPNLVKMVVITDDCLPFQAIRSLLKCPVLVKICSVGTVDMDLEDIVTITTNRSSWKAITLPSEEPLSYHALVPFAQNCPDLYKLRLTLDSKLGIPDFNTFTTDIRFSSLTLLDVGGSELLPNFELVVFLSKICSKPIAIPDSHGPWKNIEKLTNLIIATQLEIQTLKDENMLLRTQKCNYNL